MAWTLGGILVMLILAFAGLQIWFALGTKPVEPFAPTVQEQEKLALYSQPESWFLNHLQGPRETVDGQTLDPKLQYMMEHSRYIAP